MSKEKNQEFDEWWAVRSLPQKIGLGVLFGIGGLGLAFVFGLVVMALWNWLMPEIFGLTRITYWQAWGLFLLFSILFKNIDFGDNDTRSDRKRKRELRRYLRDDGESASEAEGVGESTSANADDGADARSTGGDGNAAPMSVTDHTDKDAE
jgi:hypothetical protein